MANLDDDNDNGGGGGWLISYADLMTLLFAAFVVLYGITPQGLSRTLTGVLSEIRETLLEIPDRVPENPEKGPILPGSFLFKAFSGEVPIDPRVKLYAATQDQKIAIDRDRTIVENLLDQMASEKDGMNFQLRNSMKAEPDELGFAIRLVGAYFFQKGGYRLTREGRERLLMIGKILQSFGRPLIIEGHAEKGEVAGIVEAEKLSSLRAAYSADLLVKKRGLAPTLLTTIGYGDTRPISLDGSETERRKDRRIEIKVRYLQ